MKYKHRGYRESERKSEERKKEPPKPRTPEERQLRHMMERSAKLVLRCYQCSADAPIETITGDSTCVSCSAALHVCRNCANFDTGARWECKAPITVQVLDKTAANHCELFKANTVLDATGRRSGGSAAGSDARAQFDSLFKKK
ncbi:MAG TPA: hypothetical protein VGK94_00075 [Candidatus Polarisedimenticolia bacterium]